MRLQDLKDIFEQMIRPLKNRVYTMVTRIVVDVVKNSEGMQTVKAELLAGEVRDLMEHFQDAGFTSTPIEGAEAVAVFPGGNRDHGIVLAISDRRSRPKNIPEGGAAIYSFDDSEFKQIIKVNPDGTIELGKESLESIVNGETFQTLFNAHTHTGNLLVPTGPPIVPMDNSHLSSKVKAQK